MIKKDEIKITITHKGPIEKTEIIDRIDIDNMNDKFDYISENKDEYEKKIYERIISEETTRIDLKKMLKRCYIIAFTIVMLIAAIYIVYEVYGR